MLFVIVLRYLMFGRACVAIVCVCVLLRSFVVACVFLFCLEVLCLNAFL